MAKTETLASANQRLHAFSRPPEDHQRHHKFWRRSNHRDRETAGGKSSIPAQAALEGINRYFHPSLHIATMRRLLALALCATSAAAAAVAHYAESYPCGTCYLHST